MPPQTRSRAAASALVQKEMARLVKVKKDKEDKIKFIKENYPEFSHPYQTRSKTRLLEKVGLSSAHLPPPPARARARANKKQKKEKTVTEDEARNDPPSNAVAATPDNPRKRRRSDAQEDEEGPLAGPSRPFKRLRTESQLDREPKRQRADDDEDDNERAAVEESQGTIRPAKRMRAVESTSRSPSPNTGTLLEYRDNVRRRAVSSQHSSADSDDQDSLSEYASTTSSTAAKDLTDEPLFSNPEKEEILSGFFVDFEQALLTEVNPGAEDDRLETLEYKYDTGDDLTQWLVTWRKPIHLEEQTTKATGPQFKFMGTSEYPCQEGYGDKGPGLQFFITLEDLKWQVTRTFYEHDSEHDSE